MTQLDDDERTMLIVAIANRHSKYKGASVEQIQALDRVQNEQLVQLWKESLTH